MRILSLFILLSSAIAFAGPKFVEERGKFDYSKTEIQNYFVDQKIDYFSLRDSFVESSYKINPRNQFQIQNWFGYDWHTLQKNYVLDVDKFITHYGANTFNQAKINYYQNLDFSMKKMYHVEELKFFKEWGGLNHPPRLNSQKISDLTKFSAHFNPIDYSKIDSELFSVDFNKKIDEISDSELSFGNEIKILEDHVAYDEKIKLIKKAKKTILLSTLVFVCDESTFALTQELIKKAKEGVKVYVLVDNFISSAMFHKKCPKMMKKEGIFVMWANDTFKYEFGAVYHNKKLVVDLEEAIIGGHNMLNADNLSNGTDFKNRDIDVLVHGPIVQDIALGFIEDYQHFYHKKKKSLERRARRTQVGKPTIQKRAAKRRLAKWLSYDAINIEEEIKEKINLQAAQKVRGESEYSRILKDKSQRMNGVCRFLQQAPFKDRMSIGKAYLEYMDRTKDYLGIISPEVLDTKKTKFRDKGLIEKFDKFTMYNLLHDKLMEMGNRDGFQMDYITSGPEIAGNESVVMEHEKIRKNLDAGKVRTANFRMRLVKMYNNYFGKPHFTNIINDYVPLKNVDVWAHISFMHSKITYFDRIAASIGSYNYHHNATDHSFENTIICFDEDLNRALDEVFVRDMVNSTPMKYRSVIK